MEVACHLTIAEIEENAPISRNDVFALGLAETKSSISGLKQEMADDRLEKLVSQGNTKFVEKQAATLGEAGLI